uniref:Uncharacterized protein n=1 Tax=Oryza glumipatula TaxID=40148 RepID=A0A0E0BJE7_9ORYZ
MGKSTAIGPVTGRSTLLPSSGYGGAVEKVVEAQGEVKAASVMAAATTTTSCGDSATATATTSYNDNVTGEWELARADHIRCACENGLPGVASPRFIFL